MSKDGPIKGWMAATLLACTGLVASAAAGVETPAEPGAARVRLTFSLDWSVPPPLPTSTTRPPQTIPPALESDPIEIAVEDGELLGVVADLDEGLSPERVDTRRWQLGRGRSGRVRVRLEAPTDGSLIVRAAGQDLAVPVATLAENGPRGVIQGGEGVEIGFERLPWDALEVATPAGGLAEPGETVPVTVGLNLIVPGVPEVPVRLTAELHPLGGEMPTWRDDRSLVARTSSLAAPTIDLAVPLPAEGLYVLELRATWETPAAPPQAESPPRLGRLLRRRRGVGSVISSATRRVTLGAVASQPDPAELRPRAERAVAEVDSVDFERPRASRPLASGRSPRPERNRADWAVPAQALVEPQPRDRLLGWVGRGVDVANLGPADGSDLAWSAVGLRVPRPSRPHRLTLTIVGGSPEALGVALVAPGVEPGRPPRVTLDAAASGPPVVVGGPPTVFSWVVWPDAPNPALVVVNRGSAASVKIGGATLVELAEAPVAPPAVARHQGEPRSLGLHLASAAALDRFGGGWVAGAPGAVDLVARSRNLADSLAHLGATAAVLPEALADRDRRAALGGQAEEDAIGPDPLALTLRVLNRRGLAGWVELDLGRGPLPGLPAADDPEALRRGLVRVDRKGRADGPTYHPLSPEVRSALRLKVTRSIAPGPSPGTAPAGVLVRLGEGATLLGGPDTGLDDATFGRFAAATFEGRAPLGTGLEATGPARFEARARFLDGPGRHPWQLWRAREVAGLYAELAEAARSAAPGAGLMVCTPSLDDGPAGGEATRVDLVGLAADHAWKAVGLDLDLWPAEDGPIVLRGVALGGSDLARDLATSPDLDAQVAGRPRRGLAVLGTGPVAGPGAAGAATLSALPLPVGPDGDMPIGHGMAALDPRWMLLDSAAVAGQEDRVRRIALLFRSVPAGPTDDPAPGPQPVVVRARRAGPSTFLTMANDTPYPLRVEAVLASAAGAPVDDLGRGIRLAPAPSSQPGGARLVLDLEPFGLAAVRVGSDRVRLAQVVPHPPAAVLAGMKAQYDDLSLILTRLDRLGVEPRTGPANPGFEPRTVQLTGSGEPHAPHGWRAAGPESAEAELDATITRSGRTSLRLDAPQAPASVASDPFRPPGGPSLEVSAWLRSDRPEARVRLWFEAASQGPGAPNSTLPRQAEMAVGPDWVSLGLEVAGLPAEGLDRARVRFELLTPGRLWVDDLVVAGTALTEPERLNARRALSAALQAYREKRYADFARLAGSHWARRADDARLIEPAGPVLRTGDASDLPPSRALR